MPTALQDAAHRATTLTFDCYGTLIDWDAGLRGAFREAFGPEIEPRLPELYDLYNRIEAEVEAGPYRPYREVMAEALRRTGEHFRLSLAPGAEQALADSLGAWRPFPDTNPALVRLKKRYRLGVLSNIDRDLFALTARHFDVAFDYVITAEDVRQYKPAEEHFRRAIDTFGPPERIIHVAQSLFHDAVPAGRMGLAFVWVNRYKHSPNREAAMLAELPDLASLADALGC